MSIDLMGVGVVVPTLRGPSSSSNTNLNLLRSSAPLYTPAFPPFVALITSGIGYLINHMSVASVVITAAHDLLNCWAQQYRVFLNGTFSRPANRITMDTHKLGRHRSRSIAQRRVCLNDILSHQVI